MDKVYCIEVQRECEELYITHERFHQEPTRKEVLDYVLSLDLNYDDNYGRINFYEVDL